MAVSMEGLVGRLCWGWYGGSCACMEDTFWWSTFYFYVFRCSCLGCRNFYVG